MGLAGIVAKWQEISAFENDPLNHAIFLYIYEDSYYSESFSFAVPGIRISF